MTKIKYKRINAAATAPKKAFDSDSGYDVTAVSFEKKDFTIIASTGLVLDIPEGYEVQVRSRSGMASKGVVVANSPGTIDAGYRGELKVILGSITGQCPFIIEGGIVRIGQEAIKKGDRVAQIVVQPVIKTVMEESDDVSDSDRGEGGLGSTGA